tara:strand:- start:2051 stop:2446 length:396 start_codon:yes stop_codon:yes gene_type:complete
MKINIFDTFEEAKQAQEYDHLYQIAVALATVCEVSLETVRENNLHILQDGVFPLEDYVIQNNIEIYDLDLYERVIKHWKMTTGWSDYFKYQDKFAYCKDHSDICWDWIEVDFSKIELLDKEGNLIQIQEEI